MNHDTIAILDFGGQYTQLIAKAVRSLNVYSEIFSGESTLSQFEDTSIKGIILSGGPESVTQIDAPMMDKEILLSGIPILGICYGMQLINYLLNGKNVEVEERQKEYGETEIQVDIKQPLFKGLPEKISSWMSHGDSVDSHALGEGLFLTASSEHHLAAFSHQSLPVFGVQFHPEVSHMPLGKEMIKNFLFSICACQATWSMESYIQEIKKEIFETVQNKEIISFVSGGVDSCVATSMIAQTPHIAPVHAVYIEGLMRKGETEEVQSTMKKAGVDNLTVFQAEDAFIKELEGVQDPEEKRKRIGNLFGLYQEKACEQIGLNSSQALLIQGTLYTDLIESGKGVGAKAKIIKSHHNVGCTFIEELKEQGRIVEPNKYIFKDEVRQAALALGFPKQLCYRQPFPGPGLAIRIVGGKEEWIDATFYKVEEKVQQIAHKYEEKALLWPIKTVGVQGDDRTYSFVAMLKLKEKNWRKARSIAKEITTHIHEVNRVVLDLTPETKLIPSSQIHIPTFVSKETVKTLQELDFKGRKIIEEHSFPIDLSQTIFVLCGVDPYLKGKRTLVLRAVLSDDFMTVTPSVLDHEVSGDTSLTWSCLEEISAMSLESSDIGAFAYDITDKPPATTEWE